MRHRELFGSRIVMSFILASVVFIAIFSLSYGVSYLNYQSISAQANVLQSSVTELDKILSGFECNSKLLIESSESFDNAAAALSLLEKRFGKHDLRVLEQKKLYSELQYKHFLLTERFNRECKSSFITVLFFYSNDDARLEDLSERMGYILTAFENEDVDRIMIYSFDANLDSPIIDYLKSQYSIGPVPVVVVSNSTIFAPRSISDMDRYLD